MSTTQDDVYHKCPSDLCFDFVRALVNGFRLSTTLARAILVATLPFRLCFLEPVTCWSSFASRDLHQRIKWIINPLAFDIIFAAICFYKIVSQRLA